VLFKHTQFTPFLGKKLARFGAIYVSSNSKL